METSRGEQRKMRLQSQTEGPKHIIPSSVSFWYMFWSVCSCFHECCGTTKYTFSRHSSELDQCCYSTLDKKKYIYKKRIRSEWPFKAAKSVLPRQAEENHHLFICWLDRHVCRSAEKQNPVSKSCIGLHDGTKLNTWNNTKNHKLRYGG